MNLTVPFLASVGAAVAINFLDWHKTVNLIKAKGLAGEKNPIMRFLMARSKYAGLAYKMWPYPLLVWGALIHFRDVQNYGVRYSNAAGTDHWGLAWIATALGCAGLGLYGYLKSEKK